MNRPLSFLPVATLALAVPAIGPAAEEGLRVRSSAVSAPCVEAAGQAWAASEGRPVTVEEGGLRDAGAWDVLVGSSVELTRALEGRDADIDSDVDVAHIPWVLHLGAGGGVRSLSELSRSRSEVVMLGGAAAYEARRALAEEGVETVLETTDIEALRSAPVALVPLSLAGAGERVKVDVPPIRIGAAVGARARDREAAGAFVRYLSSEPGQAAFAACPPVQ